MKLALAIAAAVVGVVGAVIGIAALYAHIFTQFANGELQTIPRAIP